LVEEDEFQDEHHLYEKVIANQALVDGDFADMAAVAETLSDRDELKSLFYGMMAFFGDPNPTESQWAAFAQSAPNPPLDSAVYQIIIHFNK